MATVTQEDRDFVDRESHKYPNWYCGVAYELAAELREAKEALAKAEAKFEKRVEREDQLSDHAIAFWRKYGRPPKPAPSCFLCGCAVPTGFRVAHIDLPGIGVCDACAALRAENEKLKRRLEVK